MNDIKALENGINYYPVFSLTMANYLVRCGFDIVKVDDNEKNIKYKKFLFHDSVQLRKSMSKFKKQGV